MIKQTGIITNANGIDNSLQRVSPSRFCIRLSNPSTEMLTDSNMPSISSPVRLVSLTVAVLESNLIR